MENMILPSRASWFGEGLRWIGTLFVSAGDWLDRPAPTYGASLFPIEGALEHQPEFMPPEEQVFELRHRIHTGSEIFR